MFANTIEKTSIETNLEVCKTLGQVYEAALNDYF